MRLRRAFVASLSLIGCASPAAGQAPRPRAFDTVELGVAMTADPGNAGALRRYWDPEPGFELTASAPFYAGTLQLGWQQAHVAPRSADVPGFRARLLFVGWGSELAASRRLRLGAGARLGMYEMRFDGDTIPDFRRNESELGTAVRATAAYRVARAWRVHGAVSYQVVFTRVRIEQVLLSAGVSRVFLMPPWLRDFLD